MPLKSAFYTYIYELIAMRFYLYQEFFSLEVENIFVFSEQ